MHLQKLMATVVLATLAVVTAGAYQQAEARVKIQKQSFGKLADGTEIYKYVLTNKNGMEATITNYGASVVSLKVPDRRGKLADVVLGYDDAAGYENDKVFFGATIGRYGNRIGGAKFTLDGKSYNLAKNDGPNTLHGGVKGFNKVVWHARDASNGDTPALQLNYLSKDGEENFPGELLVQVTYTLTNDNELKIVYHAATDKDTVVNLTNHTYFNLKGQGEGNILDHEVTLHASRFTPVDSTLIPTGELRSVSGTPLDFTKHTKIGARIDSDYEQIKLGHGYDHNFVLDGKMGSTQLAAEVYEPTTGRVMQVLTTEPGIQFYTGNFLDGTAKGKGHAYERRTGFCLETQHFPDSPNKPEFPSTELKPGQDYKTTTIYKFSTR